MFTNLRLFVAVLAVTAAGAVPSSPAPALTLADEDLSISAAPKHAGRGALLTNPTISICPLANCAECISFTLVDRPFATCQFSTGAGPFASVKINNPDGTFIPYTVWVSFTGSTCPAGILQIPSSNTCFNLTPTGNNWLRQNSGGGTF